MKVAYQPATIVAIIDETPVVKRFFIKMPGPETFHFKPGQFVMIDLPIDSKITNRSYSIASAPSDDNTFELIIVLNPDGKGTPHMWDHYQVGSVIPVAGPLGKFVLPEVIEHDICFVATGTGIAPLRSMLHHLVKHNLQHKNVYMVFGNRTQADILYHREMEAYSRTHPFFHFIPVLSRASDDWDGHRGYVHPHYENLFADGRPATFYLCGWKNMIMEARERLTSLGYEKQHIKFELYD